MADGRPRKAAATASARDAAGKEGHGRIAASGRLLLFGYAISGFAALIYEVAWMRELGDTLGSTAYASGTMLSAFMAGLGIGSLVGARLAPRTTRPLRAAARAELAVGATSILALLALRYLPGTFFDLLSKARLSAVAFLLLQFALSFAVMLAPTIAMGLTFPLIMEAVGKRSRFGLWSGLLYTFNTAGGIAGSLLAGFVLIPLLAVKGALLLAGATSFVVAALFAHLARSAEGAPSFWRSFEPVVAVATLVALAVVPAAPPLPLGLTMLDRYKSAADYRQAAAAAKIIYDDDGVYSRVSVLEYPNGARMLRNGALIEGSNSSVDFRTMIAVAALPAASAETSRTGLVVGLGTGFTSNALLLLGCDAVTTVEINPGVVGAAEKFVLPALKRDPRWKLVIDDARSHILTQPEKYDIITSEPSWPLAASVAPLFTREFLEAGKSRLTDGGAFCQWLPSYMMRRDDLRMMYKTMREVFPRVDAWSIIDPRSGISEFALIGFARSGGTSQEQLAPRIGEITAPFEIAADTVRPYGDMASLASAVDDPSVPLNTDDHSLLEYRVIWNWLEPPVNTAKGVSGQ